MLIKADYHFHPNFSKNDIRAYKKSIKWWRAFKEMGINCVIITEHVYKNPKRAFEIMKKQCPLDILCFPGLEYVTSEGIDIIVFAKSKKIYDIDSLITPFKLSYRELVHLVKENDFLYSFITHPFTLGGTSVIKTLGMEEFKKYLNELKAIEISNGSFFNLSKLLNAYPLKLFCKKKINWANTNYRLPSKYYPANPKFFAVGSDAHIFEDIGNYYEFTASGFGSGNVFHNLVTCTDGQAVLVSKNFNFFSLIKNLPIVLSEFFIKLKIKICRKL